MPTRRGGRRRVTALLRGGSRVLSASSGGVELDICREYGLVIHRLTGSGSQRAVPCPNLTDSLLRMIGRWHGKR